MTTKEKILTLIKDINYAYNDCTMYETIKNLLEEMTEEITEQQLRDYCHKRCLTIITNDMFEYLMRKEKTDGEG